MDLPTTSHTGSEFLGLDDHTLLELEVFESSEGASLFQLCNMTNSKGGERALERRMRQPWADPCRIRDTQRTIAYIIDNRALFDAFHAGNLRYVTGSIETYMHAALPSVIADNLVEFTVSAISLYSNQANHYFSIARGVHLVRKLIATLRCFLGQPGLAAPAGELRPLLSEAKALLEGPLADVETEKSDMEPGKFWRVLRLDQLIRIREAESAYRLLSLVYEIDALLALADCTDKHKFVLPAVVEGAMQIHAEGLVHPYVHNPVANPVELDQERRGLFLTGPNMAGKTTYLRAFATALYLAHLGIGVPASSYRFVPVERLISSISLSDNLHTGVSYFRAEALRVKDIADAITAGYRVVAIMDEPFKGTNVKDTLEASLAVLRRFSARSNFLFMFSSHQVELAEQLQGPINFRYFSAIECEERLRFDYRIRSGVSTLCIGLRVLREEGVFHVLDAGS